jgi:hypothetical protein
MSDRKRFLIGVSASYALFLSLLVVRAASDPETTLYFCYGIIGAIAIFVPLALINAFQLSPAQRAEMRLKAAADTLSRSLWLEWLVAAAPMLTTSLMPALLRDKWDSDLFAILALIGAGFALFVAGWKREEARDYLAKHQPET